jgi:hypothetical protein
MQSRADDAGGGLERGQLRSLDGAVLARVVEAQHADEFAADEDRHDRLGARAHAINARQRGATVHLGLAEAHAAAGAQLAGYAFEVALVTHAGS